MFGGYSNVSFPTCKFCVNEEYFVSVGITTWSTNYLQQMAHERVSQVLFIGINVANFFPRGNSSVIRFLHAKCVSPLKFAAISQRGFHNETGECQKMVHGFINSSKEHP